MEKNENESSSSKDWTEMEYEVLMRIFTSLNMVDFVAVSRVCKCWRKVCQDHVFWDGRVLDLNKLPPRLTLSTPTMIGFLEYVFFLSAGKIGSFIFNFRLPLTDAILINIATRSRNLKRLVLPGRHLQLTEEGINQAMKLWKELESFTITDNEIACTIIEAIGKYCTNFRALKMTCHFSTKIAQALIMHVPQLKTLSLQSVKVNRDALVRAVAELQELEELNVKHSFIVGGNRPDNIRFFSQQQVPDILGEVARMPTRLMHCEALICARCQVVLIWNMANERVNPEEQIWRQDEIQTLRI